MPPRDDATAPEATYRIAGWLFVRALAAVYGIAFASLAVQLDGLIGSRGIVPAREFLSLVSQQMGPERWVYVPTLCWLGASDTMLHGLCWGGLLVAILAFFDIAPRYLLAAAWIAYASLVGVGQDFLLFQWDALLLEAGFLALLVAPSHLRPRFREAASPVPRIGLLLLWFLLFKLMFSSGAVKLLSGDPAWRHFAALQFHYETQPIPNAVAWWAHGAPAWFHRLECGMMFAIELVVPWLIPLRARWRRWAFPPLVAFQILIAVTGNFAFFNLLTLALCVLLVDDAAWPGWLRRVLESAAPPRARGPARKRVYAIARATLVGVWVLASLQFGRTFGWRLAWPDPIRRVAEWASALHVASSYGLFAVMTTSRQEIVVEGSDDGVHWQAYEFRYKPGDVLRRPPCVAPHQPRLDWQMWFAALGSFERDPWFGRFLERLLLGTPEVTRLLATNPFAAHPPRFIRAMRWDYHFSDAATRAATGAWWTRTPGEPYAPPLSLRGFEP